ncbi:MAG: ABC transporter permease [Deltaproteobacteria bacterium]|nr:MAG: ABC transporter permease [Deltaproteobacteria bacterium]
MTIDVLIPLLAATIQSGTPILYATLGEIITEKSGVLNLGVEGMMLCGALGAFLAAMFTGSPWLGFLVGGICGAMMGGLHGVVCLPFQGNQVVSGLALTILGTGLANYWGTPFVGETAPGFAPFSLPLLGSLPVIGPIAFQHDALIYTSYFLPLVVWFVFQHTSFGLALRSVGESPDAALAAGINIKACRWAGILIGGFFIGLGGAYLSLAYTHLWTNGLTAGRGWIAVALVIFAFWRPGKAVLGAYLFGGVMAFQFRLQATGTHIPSSLLMMLPYALTILVLILSSLKGRSSQAPGALGINIEPVD